MSRLVAYIGETWGYVFSTWYRHIDWWVVVWIVSCLAFIAALLGGIIAIVVSPWFILLVVLDLFFGLPWLRFVLSHA